MTEATLLSELASLGAGGMLAVIILWIVFKFLGKRREHNVTQSLHNEKVLLILENQTKILDALSNQGMSIKEEIIKISARLNGSQSLRRESHGDG